MSRRYGRHRSRPRIGEMLAIVAITTLIAYLITAPLVPHRAAQIIALAAGLLVLLTRVRLQWPVRIRVRSPFGWRRW